MFKQNHQNEGIDKRFLEGRSDKQFKKAILGILSKGKSRLHRVFVSSG
jgi:hypothetical protein